MSDGQEALGAVTHGSPTFHPPLISISVVLDKAVSALETKVIALANHDIWVSGAYFFDAVASSTPCSSSSETTSSSPSSALLAASFVSFTPTFSAVSFALPLLWGFREACFLELRCLE